MDTKKQAHQAYEFHYATFTMEPYAKGNGDSSQLLKNILLKRREENFPDDLTIIDRYKDRKGSSQRELILLSTRWESGGKFCIGKIALIKQKPIYLLSGKNLVEELKKEANKQFIAVSNYVICFPAKGDPVIMFEFNSEGPRLSDFEYSIRQISVHYKIAKKISFTLHLQTDYSSLERNISNIFNIVVKVQSTTLSVKNWFPIYKNLSDETGFKDIRLEFFYKRTKDSNGKYTKNIKGLTFARNILHWLHKDYGNIVDIEDLKMTYQTNDSDEIIDLDFIKNKSTSILQIPLFDGMSIRSEDFNEIVLLEFTNYLSTGKVSQKE